ncbi:hypothetical protein NDU88_007970 [Pleurodeles waltl]|uniref:Uncharacterized protein n=1 Tax=Pleurodeles waltl TaxID=8319 RepID=A0AAV7NXV4_PLEWA|nr:hypothetical protein NDU88_007970 [Pleurodeles waltl]
MLVGAGRFRVALPPKGSSMFNLNCPGWRESRHRRPGVPGQQSQSRRVCVPQGVCPQRPLCRAAPGDHPSSCRRSTGSPAASRHQAPPPEREAGPSPVGAFPGFSGLYLFVRVALRPRPAPGAVRGLTRDRSLNPAAGSRVPVNAGTPESAGGRHRGSSRAQAVPSAPATRRLSLKMGNRPVWCVRALITNRAAGSRQPRAAPSSPGVHTGAETAPPQPRPHALAVAHFFRCRTARSSASRLRLMSAPPEPSS